MALPHPTGDYIEKSKHSEICIHLFILGVHFHPTADLHLLKVLLKPSPKQALNECNKGEFRQL